MEKISFLTSGVDHFFDFCLYYISGKDAINFLPADGPAKDLAMKGLGAAQAVKDGKSLTDVVSEG